MPIPTAAQNQQFIDAQNPESMTDEQLKQLLIQQTQAADAEQAAGIQQQQAMYDAAREAAQNQTNTRALHGLLDSWYGTNTAQNYQPATVDEAGLLKALQESKQKLSESKNKQLKELLEARQKAKDDGKAARSEERFGASIQKDFSQAVSKSLLNPIKDARDDFAQIDPALTPGPDGKLDLKKVNLAMNNFLRGVIKLKGVFSDQDMAAAQIKNMETAIADLKLKLGEEGKVDPANFRPWAEAVDQAKKTIAINLKNELDMKKMTTMNPDFQGQRFLHNNKGTGIADQAYNSIDKSLSTLFSSNAQAGKNAPKTYPKFRDPQTGKIYEDRGGGDFVEIK